MKNRNLYRFHLLCGYVVPLSIRYARYFWIITPETACRTIVLIKTIFNDQRHGIKWIIMLTRTLYYKRCRETRTGWQKCRKTFTGGYRLLKKKKSGAKTLAEERRRLQAKIALKKNVNQIKKICHIHMFNVDSHFSYYVFQRRNTRNESSRWQDQLGIRFVYENT